MLRDWDLTAFAGYWPLFDAIFAVFRGTDSKSISNWAGNLDAHRRIYNIPGVPKKDLPPTRGVPHCCSLPLVAENKEICTMVLLFALFCSVCFASAPDTLIPCGTLRNTRQSFHHSIG
jgi:hypothetical protein